MSEITTPELEKLRARAALPRYFRIGAAALLAATVVIGIVVFFFAERPSDFRMKGFPTRLSKDVVAVIDGYERRESDGTTVKYYIKADRATTYSDNHQELENVYLEVYDDLGQRFDKITAQKALYVPAENRNFTAYFAGDVDINTRDALHIRTAQVTYSKAEDTAEAEEKVDFDREEFRGSSIGAVVHIKDQKLDLLKDVEINAVASNGSGELARNKIESFKGSGGKATIDQAAGTANLTENVKIRITPMEGGKSPGQPAELKASDVTAHFENKEINRIDLSGGVEIEQFATAAAPRCTKTHSGKGTAYLEGDVVRYELSEAAEIRTATGNANPTVIKAAVAGYQKNTDTFDLRDSVSIVTEEGERPTTFAAEQAVYDQAKGKIALSRSVKITTPSENLEASSVSADLDANRRVRAAEAKGAALLVQKNPERTVEIGGETLSATFDGDQNLQKANATGRPRASVTPISSTEYSKVSMTPSMAIRSVFGAAGAIQAIDTDGRTTIDLTAPPTSPDAADKKLTADSVKTSFASDGKNIAKAEAVGNAELLIVPQQALATSYRTTVNAPSFTCEFFPVGNNAKSCVSGLKTKTVRTPSVPKQGRGDQILVADRLTANFSGRNQDIDTLEASGATKFTELDRSGTASKILFTAANEVVSLRGGQPMIWDSRGRARADEIDIDTRNDRSTLRGNVSSTYYNQRQLNGATPFTNPAAPVYVTAGAAEFLNSEQRAVYTGNARAWQGNNYLRGDSLEILPNQKRVNVSGNVQSLVFNARSKAAKDATVPVFGSSQKMTYDGVARQIVYQTGVEIRQESDRISGDKITASLNEQGEITQAIAETGVTVTQPGRKASGEYAQYNVLDEVVLLKGNPARVEDSVNGASEGAEMTVFLRDRRVIGDGRTKTNNSGRIRTVYKVNKNQ